jgi:hypothetical protein
MQAVLECHNVRMIALNKGGKNDCRYRHISDVFALRTEDVII